MTSNNDNNQHRPSMSSSNLHLSASSLMRAYIDSLPDRITIREEISSYQFWKAIRTEFLTSFLFFVFGFGSLITSYSSSSRENLSNVDFSNNLSNSSVPYSELGQLSSALAFGLTVATLVQCAGHVSGCHLTIAITLGLCVSGRVSTVRLSGYLLAQCIASCLGAVVLFALFGSVPSIAPAPHLSTLSTSAAQVFAIEFLATFLVVLTYLANCDQKRVDLGFKALSIGFAFTVAHLFAHGHTGASLSPARALAASLLTGTWCLHWVYWVSPVVAGLFAGITYEYIGSIKGVNLLTPDGNDNVQLDHHPHQSSQLKHQFTHKPRPSPSPSPQSVITSPSSNYNISAIYSNHIDNRSHSQQTLHFVNNSNIINSNHQQNPLNSTTNSSSFRLSSGTPEALPTVNSLVPNSNVVNHNSEFVGNSVPSSSSAASLIGCTTMNGSVVGMSCSQQAVHSGPDAENSLGGSRALQNRF